ncbi:hypothetical protein H4S06_005134 [Coemansia sp. BCRC 34490]|nr:hypothetical protein H4S06_005134 [Coemansia sp. BCRC 34490]
MIDQYQLVFKPTLEAAETLTRQQSQRLGADSTNHPPPKPPRHTTSVSASQIAQSKDAVGGGAALPPALPARHVQANDDDIAALVEELGSGAVLKDSDSKTNAPRLPVTAEDIAKRLDAEQKAAALKAKQDDEARAAKGDDGETDEIVIGGFS